MAGIASGSRSRDSTFPSLARALSEDCTSIFRRAAHARDVRGSSQDQRTHRADSTNMRITPEGTGGDAVLLQRAVLRRYAGARRGFSSMDLQREGVLLRSNLQGEKGPTLFGDIRRAVPNQLNDPLPARTCWC